MTETDKLLTGGRHLMFKINNRLRGRSPDQLLADGKAILAKLNKRQHARNVGPKPRKRGRVVRV